MSHPGARGVLPGDAPLDLHRVRAREPEALDAFFDRHADRLYALVYRLLGHREAAEDALQETLFRVYRSLDTLDPARDPGPWLVTIAYNVCREGWRKDSVRHARDTDSLSAAGVEGDQLADGGAPPDLQLSQAETAAAIQHALAQLPTDLREVVVLHVYEDMPHHDIARRVGASHAAVRKRYSRALSLLSSLLRPVLLLLSGIAP